MLPRTTVEGWSSAYRIVSSRFPPVGVFDHIASPDDIEAVCLIEELTNPRVREQIGEIQHVQPEDRIVGPGTTPIMAAFTHLNPRGSRFSQGEYGVYYAAKTRATAIAETCYHVARWARASHDPATAFTLRVYVGQLHERPYHDIRQCRDTNPEWYTPDPNAYGPAQALGAALRQERSWGLLYGSVRDPEGQCIAAFRPTALAPVKQTAHLQYHWDGKRIADVLELSSLDVPGLTTQ